MVPDLAITSKRFRIAVYSGDTRVFEAVNVRDPQLLPNVHLVMFETEDRVPTTVSAGGGIIVVQEMTPTPEEEVVNQSNLIVEG